MRDLTSSMQELLEPGLKTQPQDSRTKIALEPFTINPPVSTREFVYLGASEHNECTTKVTSVKKKPQQ